MVREEEKLRRFRCSAYGLGHGRLGIAALPGMGSLISLLDPPIIIRVFNPDVANLLPKNYTWSCSVPICMASLFTQVLVFVLAWWCKWTLFLPTSSSSKELIYLVAASAVYMLIWFGSESFTGWLISNPLIVEGLLAVKLFLFVYFTKSIFYKNWSGARKRTKTRCA